MASGSVPIEPVFDYRGELTGKYRMVMDKLVHGIHTLTLGVVAPTFERAARRVVEVADPVRVETQRRESGEAVVFISLEDDSIDRESVEMLARVRNQEGVANQLTVTPMASSWRVMIPSDAGTILRLNLEITGKYLKNKNFKLSHGPVSLTLQAPEALAPEAVTGSPEVFVFEESMSWLAIGLGNLFAAFGLVVVLRCRFFRFDGAALASA